MSDYTVKQFALKEQVDPRTVRRWIAKGAVEIRRTPSGGIRIQQPQSQAVFMTLDDKIGHSTH